MPNVHGPPVIDVGHRRRHPPSWDVDPSVGWYIRAVGLVGLRVILPPRESTDAAEPTRVRAATKLVRAHALDLDGHLVGPHTLQERVDL
eukprot:3179776-Prymnesium_polylepis.1